MTSFKSGKHVSTRTCSSIALGKRLTKRLADKSTLTGPSPEHSPTKAAGPCEPLVASSMRVAEVGQHFVHDMATKHRSSSKARPSHGHASTMKSWFCSASFFGVDSPSMLPSSKDASTPAMPDTDICMQPRYSIQRVLVNLCRATQTTCARPNQCMPSLLYLRIQHPF